MMKVKVHFTAILILYLPCICVFGIGEIPNSLLAEMRNVSSTKEFFDKFIVGGYKAFKESMELLSGDKPLELEDTSSSCKPMKRPVKVPPAENPNWLSYPECVDVDQCDSCCNSLLTSCQTIETRTINFRVSRIKYNSEVKMLERVRDESFSVEEHLKCACRCIMKASDCTENQHYSEKECACICTNREEISHCLAVGKIWDTEMCQCICKEIEECSSGYFFNPIICRCEHV